VVPEAGQHPALHDLDADFHLGLIPWPSAISRKVLGNVVCS
jgi:hypothetical protein